MITKKVVPINDGQHDISVLKVDYSNVVVALVRSKVIRSHRRRRRQKVVDLITDSMEVFTDDNCDATDENLCVYRHFKPVCSHRT